MIGLNPLRGSQLRAGVISMTIPRKRHHSNIEQIDRGYRNIDERLRRPWAYFG